MLITLVDLEREPLHYNTSFAPGAIPFGPEAEQKGPLAAAGVADLLREHRGPKQVVEDIRVRGACSGHFQVPCARCLDPVDHMLDASYDVLFRPVGVDTGAGEHSLGSSETEIGYYEQGGLLLEDVLREQVLLSLPARTLCREDCRGLCPHCGINRNSEACTCEAPPADSRWAALSSLSSRVKTT